LIAFSQSLMTQRSLVVDLLYEKLFTKSRPQIRYHQVSGMKNSQHNLMICIVKGITPRKTWGYC
jgi:hypothetical protein